MQKGEEKDVQNHRRRVPAVRPLLYAHGYMRPASGAEHGGGARAQRAAAEHKKTDVAAPAAAVTVAAATAAIPPRVPPYHHPGAAGADAVRRMLQCRFGAAFRAGPAAVLFAAAASFGLEV